MVAARLAAGEMDKAAAIVRQERKSPHSQDYVADLEGIAAILDDASRIVQFFFSDKIGQSITINDKGLDRKVTVRSVTGFAVMTEYEDNANPTPTVTSMAIPFVNLDPVLLARLTGQETTAGQSLLNYVLCMKTGDYAAARKSAARCGPLSDALTKMADARRRDSEKQSSLLRSRAGAPDAATGTFHGKV